MNKKRAAVCGLTFYPLEGLNVETGIGVPTARIIGLPVGMDIPMVNGELSEIRNEVGGFIEAEFSSRLTDNSLDALEMLLYASYRYGVFVLKYTDDSCRLLGLPDSPVMLTYEQKGIPSAYELSIKAQQPEFSKILKV